MKSTLFIFLSFAACLGFACCQKCNNYCRKTYPLHTFPKEQQYYSCIRGCRLGKINQLSGNLRTNDEVVNFCKMDCRHAYDDNEDLNACHGGCKEQDILPTPAGLLQAEMEKASYQIPVIHHFALQPVHIVRKYCAGMMSNVVTFVAMRTALVVDAERDSVTVHVEQGGPFIRIDSGESSDEATRLSRREEKPKASLPYYRRLYHHGTRWIDCVAAKAHLPPWLLSFALLLCFFTAIWLCCTTIFGGSSQDEKRYSFERIISAQSMDTEKHPLFTVDTYEAPPLPSKSKLVDIA